MFCSDTVSRRLFRSDTVSKWGASVCFVAEQCADPGLYWRRLPALVRTVALKLGKGGKDGFLKVFPYT